MSSDVHISPTSSYLAVFGALIVLTAITVWVSFYDLGAWSDLVAIGIAVTKATLVILFFMHVKYGPKLNKLVVTSGVLWVLIMFGLTLIDYTTRERLVTEPADIGSSIVLDKG